MSEDKLSPTEIFNLTFKRPSNFYKLTDQEQVDIDRAIELPVDGFFKENGNVADPDDRTIKFTHSEELHNFYNLLDSNSNLSRRFNLHYEPEALSHYTSYDSEFSEAEQLALGAVINSFCIANNKNIADTILEHSIVFQDQNSNTLNEFVLKLENYIDRYLIWEESKLKHGNKV